MLVKKEVIRPGKYFYQDTVTGLPRKLVVTPELTKHWHDEGNKMLLDGLTVPIPMEHDFNSHPMTPAEKLKSNAGWVKEYKQEGDKLFAVCDITDNEVKGKLAGSIRWTSPWFSSFTDGSGKSWKNVISHLALTTRPRVIDQAPFGSIAASLSIASETPIDTISDKGVCLSRAGLLTNEGQPKYPVAFSMWSGVALNTEHDESGKFTGPGKGPGKGKAKKKTANEHSSHAESLSSMAGSGHDDINEARDEARGHATRALKSAGEGDNQQASYHHMKASESHYALAKHPKHEGTYFAKAHMAAHEAHNDAAEAHMSERKKKINTSMALGNEPPKKKAVPPKKEKPDVNDEGDKGRVPDELEGGGLDGEGEGEYGEGGGLDDDLGGEDFLDPLADAGGDVQMEELLCDLLQALGVPMPDQSNETEFKRHLYEAAMSKIKELAAKSLTPDPNANKQPGAGQQPGGQPNPIIQQEQQPMYMSLEEINKLPDPMKGVALAMYGENQKLRAEMDANAKLTSSLRDGKLKEVGSARTTRAALLGKLSPKIKADLDAMLALPSMALSMGEGGAVVDPMETMLSMLEKSLASLPRLLTTDHTALSIHEHPKDMDEMTEERENEISDSLARQMGCAPEKKAS